MSHKRSKARGRRDDKAPSKKIDTSPLIGNVNLTNKDVQVYLVKMPEQLASQFDNPSAGVVGRLRLSQPPAANSSASTAPDQPIGKIFLDKAPSTGPAGSRRMLSTEYDVVLQRQNPDILVFSSNATGDEDQVRIEGVVSSQCQARPAMTDAFRRMTGHRTYVMNRKTSRMQQLDESKRKEADLAGLEPTAMTKTTKEREKDKKQKEDARRHLDVPDDVWRENTRLHVFKAFEIQPYYSADELAKAVGETATRIRPIIGEVCSYNKAGPSAGRYELKDEYKTVTQRQQKLRELANFQRTQAEVVKKRKEERAEREKEEASKTKKPRFN